jgi:hypothetical protein
MNEEILGGLKSAIERGQPLQKAMMSLYSAGYKREEIEEAARSLAGVSEETSEVAPIAPKVSPAPPSPPAPKIIPEEIPVAPMPSPEPVYKPSPRTSEYDALKKQVKPRNIAEVYAPVQRVSSYEDDSGKEKTIIIFLVFLLIVLSGLLGLIFLFKEQIINFFGQFFS